MKISDVLRKIADTVEADEIQKEKEDQASMAAHQHDVEQAKLDGQDLVAGQVAQVVDAANRMQQAAELQRSASDMNAAIQAPAVNSHELTPADNTDATDQETMIGPLQQKHELLKKATNTSNDVDKFDDGMEDHKDDELEILKKMAGINEPEQGALPQDEYGQGSDVSINPKKNAALMIQLGSDEFDT